MKKILKIKVLPKHGNHQQKNNIKYKNPAQDFGIFSGMDKNRSCRAQKMKKTGQTKQYRNRDYGIDKCSQYHLLGRRGVML